MVGARLGQGFTHNENQILWRVKHGCKRNPGFRLICITPSRLAIPAKAVTLAPEGKPENGRSRGEGSTKYTMSTKYSGE